MRNQEWLPRFPQKPQTKWEGLPILIINDFHPTPSVNDLATVTHALTNVLFGGMEDRGGDKDLDTRRLLSDTICILRGFWNVPGGIRSSEVGKRDEQHPTLGLKQ